jgi:cell division protein FtsQ
MARKSSTAIPDEEQEVTARGSYARSLGADESPLDQRMLDLDEETESPFLRGQKRVPVRRGALPRNATGRVRIILQVAGFAVVIAVAWFLLQHYGTSSWRFRLDSSDNITISGMNNVARSQLLDVMASDIDRNIFFVPLEQRKKQLEQIPWVQSAAIMRLLPNRVKIVVSERTPVAFVQVNSHIEMIDANGVIMELPTNQETRYSFPVIVGISDNDPLSVRAARMKIYMRFMQELDSSGAHYSADISDVDLSDPDDVRATVTDPRGAVLVHLGGSNFLEHFQVYVTHVQEWRTQFPKLDSVDLRYDHQVIVNPDSAREAAKPKPAPPKSETAAVTKQATEHKKTASKAKKHT